MFDEPTQEASLDAKAAADFFREDRRTKELQQAHAAQAITMLGRIGCMSLSPVVTVLFTDDPKPQPLWIIPEVPKTRDNSGSPKPLWLPLELAGVSLVGSETPLAQAIIMAVPDQAIEFQGAGDEKLKGVVVKTELPEESIVLALIEVCQNVVQL